VVVVKAMVALVRDEEVRQHIPERQIKVMTAAHQLL
jgi:hypothetical protein